MNTDILVVGGGILGTAAAYYLALRGADVVVSDNGALPGQATAATTAGLTLQNRSAERLPFYRASAGKWSSLSDELDCDLGYTRSGSLTVAHTTAEFEEIRTHAQTLSALGLEVNVLSAQEAKGVAPWVADDIAGATFCPEDGFMEPDRPLAAFREAAIRQGVSYLSHSPVTAIESRDSGGFLVTTSEKSIECAKIINAAGAWAGQVAAMVGLNLPITLDPLQAMSCEPTGLWLDMVVLHANKRLTLKQNGNGRVVIGGGWRAEGRLDGTNIGVTTSHYEANLALARASVPRLNHLAIDQSWVGLEGRSPDRLPFFGEVGDIPGFYMLACVHGGVTMSPLLGESMAELIVDGRNAKSLRAFTTEAFLPLTSLD